MHAPAAVDMSRPGTSPQSGVPANGEPASPEGEPTSLGDPRLRTLTIGLVSTITLIAFEALAVVTALPLVAEALDGVGLYGWSTSGFFLGTVVGVVIAGSGTDRSGPVRPLLTGLAFFAGGLALAALAPTMEVLVAGRVLQGLGGGAVPAIAYATIGRVYPEALRPRVFAVLSSAWVLPGLGGPALSALVAEHLSWRWVFGGLLPLLLVSGALTLRALRRVDGPAGGDAAASLPLVAALRVSAGAGLMLAGITSRSLPGIAAVVAGLLIGFGPLRRLLPAGTLLARRGIPSAVAARGLLTFAFFGADTFVPLAVTAVRGHSTTIAGIAVSAATLSWTTGSWTQARLAGRRPGRDLITAGFACVALGVAGFATVLATGFPLPVPILFWALAGFGMGAPRAG